MRYNFKSAGYVITDEVVSRANNPPARIGHDLLRDDGFEVWTGEGKTGTALVLGTDFDLTVKDVKRTMRAGFDLFTLFSIINATYFNTTLYLTYTTCGDYLSIENVTEVADEAVARSAAPIISLAVVEDYGIPPSFVVGTRRSMRRLADSSTTPINLLAPSGATIEGRASVQLYGKYDFITLERITEDLFVIVDSTKYPLGSFYVQYPIALSNDAAIAFPARCSPANMFGGTWEEQFADEGVFFRTGGTLAGVSRTNGKQLDAIIKHGHDLYLTNIGNGGGSGGVGFTPNSNKYTGCVKDPVALPGGPTVRTADENLVTNRLHKIWLRTA